jgi:endo-1,4-beta-xylanase
MKLRVAFSTALILMVLAGCSGGGSSGGSNPPPPPPPPAVDVPNLYVLAPGNMPVGVAVPAGSASNSMLTSMLRQTIVNDHFSQITAENIMKPSYLHPGVNTYFFDDADALVDYAVSQGKTVHGHVLIWHQQLPAWMQNFGGNATEWTSMMENHVDTIVRHFALRNPGVVVSWDVVNEAFGDVDADMNGLNDLRDTIWLQHIGPGYIAEAFRTARAADFDADLYYNDYNLAGVPAKLAAVLDMVDQFANDPNPVPIDGIGFQMHVSLDWPAIADIRAALAAAAGTGLKVRISELDVTVNTDSAGNAGPLSELTGAVAAEQQQRYEDIVSAYLDAVPAAQRGGIAVWGIADVDSWRRSNNAFEWPLLFDDQFEPKLALQGFADGLTGN